MLGITETNVALAVGLPWLVLWVPAAMVCGRMWLGLDLYEQFPAWTLANLAVGIAMIAAVLWVARRLSTRPPSAPWLENLIDDLAGGSLVRASRQLDDLAAFRSEA